MSVDTANPNYPRLSIFIPTHDPNRPLDRILKSIQNQPIGPDDEVLVGIDEFGLEAPDIMRIVKRVLEYGPQFRAITVLVNHSCWGHCVINNLLVNCKKDYIVGNDDDDIFTKGAFDAIRAEIKKLPVPKPLMFKFQPYFGGRPLWQEKKLVEGRIGAHCLVTPNIPEKVGRFTCRYAGDFDWVRDTLTRWNMDVAWVDPVIAIGRPAPKDWWWMK